MRIYSFEVGGVVGFAGDALSTLIAILVVILGVVAIVMAMRAFFNGDVWPGFAYLAGAFGAGGMAILITNGMFRDLLDGVFEAGPAPTASPSSPERTPIPSPSSSPSPDFEIPPVLVPVGIAVGGLVLLLLVIALAEHLIAKGRSAKRAKQARDEDRKRLERTWQAFRDDHNELLRKIYHSETDWDSLFLFPSLTDPTVRQTGDMLTAMRDANTLRDTAGHLPSSATADTDLTKLPYPKAVARFARTWNIAERHARMIGQKNIPKAEQRTINEIRTLLDLAENGAASTVERSLAYRRAHKLIKKLNSITIPRPALDELEQRQARALDALTPAH